MVRSAERRGYILRLWVVLGSWDSNACTGAEGTQVAGINHPRPCSGAQSSSPGVWLTLSRIACRGCTLDINCSTGVRHVSRWRMSALDLNARVRKDLGSIYSIHQTPDPTAVVYYVHNYGQSRRVIVPELILKYILG